MEKEETKNITVDLRDAFSGATKTKTLTLPTEKVKQLEEFKTNKSSIHEFSSGINWQWIIEKITYNTPTPR